jgi:hypothetical protein
MKPVNSNTNSHAHKLTEDSSSSTQSTSKPSQKSKVSRLIARFENQGNYVTSKKNSSGEHQIDTNNKNLDERSVDSITPKPVKVKKVDLQSATATQPNKLSKPLVASKPLSLQKKQYNRNHEFKKQQKDPDTTTPSKPLVAPKPKPSIATKPKHLQRGQYQPKPNILQNSSKDFKPTIQHADNITNKQEVTENEYTSELEKLRVSLPGELQIKTTEQAIEATATLEDYSFKVEISKNVEADKGQTLKLTLSDEIDENNEEYLSYTQGKLKRCWFLTQLLQNTGLSKNADDIKASFEKATGTLTIEISNIKNNKEMLDKLPKFVSALNTFQPLARNIEIMVGVEYEEWNFSVLQQKLNDISSEQSKNDFLLYFSFISHEQDLSEIEDKQLNAIFNIVNKVGAKKGQDPFNRKIDQTELEELINNIDINNQETVLKALLRFNNSSIIEFVRSHHPDWFTNKEKMQELVAVNGLLLQYASDEIRNDSDIALAAVKNHFRAMNDADENLVKHKEFPSSFVNGVLNIVNFPGIKKDEYSKIFEIIDQIYLSDKKSVLDNLSTCDDSKISNYIAEKYPDLVNEDD